MGNKASEKTLPSFTIIIYEQLKAIIYMEQNTAMQKMLIKFAVYFFQNRL